MKRRILGFSHFRTDLGDGTRTGVYFNGCSGNCSEVCVPDKFLKEHPFCGDTCEKALYSPSELVEYLKEEKLWCYTKPLGITFLGKEPLADPEFCKKAGDGIKELGMDLQIITCANCSFSDLYLLHSVCDLFIVRYFSLIPNCHKPFLGFDPDRVNNNLRLLDRSGIAFRLLIPVLPGVNEPCPGAMAKFVSSFQNIKSVILDFHLSSLSLEEQREYRKKFLDQGVILY